MAKKQTIIATCPCQWHAGHTYAQCCQPYVDGHKFAPSAEALMRSRYSAYVYEQADYLKRTWHESTRPEHMDFEPTQWLGLSVLESQQEDEQHATVTFTARYKVGGRAFKMHECSRFLKEGEQWLYVDGDVNQ